MLQLLIKYRVTVTIFVLEALMVGVVLWQITALSIRATHDQQVAYEQVTLSPLADVSRIALMTDEHADVQAHFQRVANDKDVLRILLADANGRVVASTTATDIGLPMPPLPDDENRYWRERDIGNEGGKTGVLAVEFSRAAMLGAHRDVLNLGIGLALAGTVIIAIVAVLMGYLPTRKLNVLTETAQRIAGGDLQAVSGLEGDDEVSKVGHAIDHMARTIQKRVEGMKESREAMRYQALHDILTGLPNRSLFQDRIGQELRAAERGKNSFSILMIDLNKFKQINDTLGHHIGDRVLQEVSNRLQGALRASDTVSRFGGDEFMILLPGKDAAGALRVVDKIRTVFEPALQIDGNNLSIMGSIGIAVYPQHGKDPDTLIRHADVAMYTAKKSDVDYAVYDSG